MSKRKPAFTVLYEGPAGYKSGRLCQTTRLVITTRTIEIERDGVDCVPAVLTCGLEDIGERRAVRGFRYRPRLRPGFRGGDLAAHRGPPQHPA